MVCKIVYNDLLESFKSELVNICSDILVEEYNEDYYKEKRKAIMIKAGCGTRLLPFVAFFDNKELVKAFYMEDKSCTIPKIEEWINKTR